MSTPKEHWGVAAVGLAAAAIAGYLIYKSRGPAVAVNEETKQDDVPEEVKELKTFFFIDSGLSQEEKEEAISAWVKEQIEELLGASPEGKLIAKEGKLSTEDFLHLTSIVENRVKVYLFQEQDLAVKARLETIEKKGFWSVEYLQELLDNVRQFIEIAEEPREEILKQVSTNATIMEASYENHVGTEEEIHGDFIKKSLELLFFMPIKNSVSKTAEEAKEIMLEIIENVTKRMSQEDTFTIKFATVAEYIHSFDQALVDYAHHKHNLAEQDFRALVYDHELLDDSNVSKKFATVAEHINNILDYEPVEEEEEEVAEEAEVEEPKVYEVTENQPEAETFKVEDQDDYDEGKLPAAIIEIEVEPKKEVEEEETAVAESSEQPQFVEQTQKVEEVVEPTPVVEEKKEEKVEETKVEAPIVVEEVKPVVEQVKAVVEEVKKEQPVAAEPKKEEPVAAEPKKEEPKVEAPKVEEPKKEAPKVEPKKEEPKVEAPKVEPKKEEPKKEATKVEAPKVEEPKKEEVKKVEEPKKEAPKVETPKVEAPKVEEPKKEAPKVEAAKVEEPKKEAPKVEAAKVEEPKKEEVKKVEEPKKEEPKKEAAKQEPQDAPKVEAVKVEESKKEQIKEKIVSTIEDKTQEKIASPTDEGSQPQEQSTAADQSQEAPEEKKEEKIIIGKKKKKAGRR